MQKKSLLKLFFELLGYVLAGNLLSLVVTISLSGFLTETNENIIFGISSVCSILLLITCVFSVGYKDGELERKLINRKTLEKPDPNKWFIIGGIVWILMCILCAMLNIIPGTMYLQVFRFAVASMFALSLFFGSSEIPAFAPFIFMGVFALIPVACRVGYYAGFYDKIAIDNIIYKKKK